MQSIQLVQLHIGENILQLTHKYIYGGSAPAGITTSGFTDGTATAFGNLDTDGGWDQDADGVNFGLSGVFTGSLGGGTNYGGKTDYTTSGALNSGIDDLITGYELFTNTEEIEVDFILMGAAHHVKEQSQAVAEKVIQVAESKKRCSCICFTKSYILE